MSTDDLIIGLYVWVDMIMAQVPKPNSTPANLSQLACSSPSRPMVPAASITGSATITAHGSRAYPAHRLFRLLATHADWAKYFLVQATLLGIADTYGIELRHPWREDRADQQIGSIGLSNHRWIVGMKVAYVVNRYGLLVAWDYAAANVADNAFRDLIADFQEEIVILTGMAFHGAAGDPPHQKACKRGTWNVRMVVETVLALLTTVCRLKKVSHRTWCNLAARLAYTMALFNVLVMCDGLPVDEHETLHLSIAEFAL